MVCVASGYLPGIVVRTGIDNDDFIDSVTYTVQTAREHLALVFDNHAQTDGYHLKTPPFGALYASKGGVRHNQAA